MDSGEYEAGVTSDGRTTRRIVLLGTSAAGAVAVLAACGASTTSDPTGQPTTDTTTDLGPTSDIPVGGGKIFASQDVVVTQPKQGTFKCFTATCTHQGCTVGTVSGGQIICPCHGSRYSIADGSVVQGPAPSPLAAKSITVTNGDITLV